MDGYRNNKIWCNSDWWNCICIPYRCNYQLRWCIKMKATELYNVYTEIMIITKMDLHGSINHNEWSKDKIKTLIVEE